jgi:putative ABC transport system permease protein
MFTAFGGIAVVLAVVGIYSVKSYIVARRTQEIGIRMALGASSTAVLAMILKQGILQTVIGVIVGLSLGVFAGQFLSKLLYRVNPLDASTMIVATTLLSVVSILACLAPAMRATRINAAVALRSE